MHTAILLLTDHYDDHSAVDRYIHHFSEQFTNLGYRVVLGYGRKSDLDVDSPVIQEWHLPYLDEPYRPQTTLELQHLSDLAQGLLPRLVVLHSPCDPAVINTLRSALPGVPLVWFAHRSSLQEVWTRHLSSHDGYEDRKFEGGLSSLWERFFPMLPDFHAVVTEGEAWSRILARGLPAGAPPVMTLPPSSSAHPFDHSKALPRCVLFSGDMVPDKGLAELVQAMGMIGSVGERSLLAAGPAPNPDYLRHCESLAARLMGRGEAFRATFHPDPDPECLHHLYQKAMVLAVPSTRPEPTPPEALEAMAHGLPVVAGNVGGVDVLVRDGETGLLVEPGNVEDLAEKLAWILSEDDRLRRMGNAAGDFAAWSFGARDHVIALNRVFEDLIYPADRSTLGAHGVR